MHDKFQGFLAGFISVFFVVSLFGLSACDKKADVTSPKTYYKQGISFKYPGNWEVSEDEKNAGFRYIILEGSADAVFVIQVYDKQENEEDNLSLKEFAENFSSQVIQDIPLGTASTGVTRPHKRILSTGETEGLIEHFSISLLGIRVPHIREYYVITKNKKIIYFIAQTPSDERANVEPGFGLILKSFQLDPM